MRDLCNEPSAAPVPPALPRHGPLALRPVFTPRSPRAGGFLFCAETSRSPPNGAHGRVQGVLRRGLVQPAAGCALAAAAHRSPPAACHPIRFSSPNPQRTLPPAQKRPPTRTAVSPKWGGISYPAASCACPAERALTTIVRRARPFGPERRSTHSSEAASASASRAAFADPGWQFIASGVGRT